MNRSMDGTLGAEYFSKRGWSQHGEFRVVDAPARYVWAAAGPRALQRQRPGAEKINRALGDVKQWRRVLDHPAGPGPPRIGDQRPS